MARFLKCVSVNIKESDHHKSLVVISFRLLFAMIYSRVKAVSFFRSLNEWNREKKRGRRGRRRKGRREGKHE